MLFKMKYAQYSQTLGNTNLVQEQDMFEESKIM
jgi:hypothetical protein